MDFTVTRTRGTQQQNVLITPRCLQIDESQIWIPVIIEVNPVSWIFESVRWVFPLWNFFHQRPIIPHSSQTELPEVFFYCMSFPRVWSLRWVMRLCAWCFADSCAQIPQQTPLKTTSRSSHGSWTVCWTATIIAWDPDWEVRNTFTCRWKKHKCTNLTDSVINLSIVRWFCNYSFIWFDFAHDNHKIDIK